jgi:hypothetical protein
VAVLARAGLEIRPRETRAVRVGGPMERAQRGRGGRGAS